MHFDSTVDVFDVLVYVKSSDFYSAFADLRLSVWMNTSREMVSEEVCVDTLILQYLATTHMYLLGPLVTSENVTVRSDLRLYTSDNNITMEG